MEPRIHIRGGSMGSNQGQLAVLQESEYRHSQIFENLAVPVYTCDINGFITFYNKAATQLWGRTPIKGIDRWCGALKVFGADGVTPLEEQQSPLAIATREGRSIRGMDIVIERPDGKRLNIMTYPDPVKDSKGKVVGGVNILVDITDLKKKELELRETRQRCRQIAGELEQRVDERTKALQHVNHALQKSNEELEQFAFIASHDMQEPLRKIKTFSQRLEQSAGKYFDDRDLQYLQKIKKSSDRMSNLIDDILDYSRLDHADASFEDVNLDEVLGDVLDDFEIRIEQKNAKVVCSELPRVKAIPSQMHQLFHNLVSNSLKFCRSDEPCFIRITTRLITGAETGEKYPNIEPARSYHEIVVSDNGVGFEQEYAERIFNIFERLHTAEYTGTGIGLALCRKIANLHGGEIFAKSAPGEGTEMHVLLPAG